MDSRRAYSDVRTYSDVANYAVILWDNDGVLVDTERWYFQATREVFAGAGIGLTVELYFEYFLSRSRGTSSDAYLAAVARSGVPADKCQYPNPSGALEMELHPGKKLSRPLGIAVRPASQVCPRNLSAHLLNDSKGHCGCENPRVDVG